MSKYLQREFKQAFTEICEMWTGDDGMLMSLTVSRSPDAEKILREHQAFGKIEQFDPSRMVPKYAYRWRPEFPSKFGGRRVLWAVCDEVTDFPIYEYELEFPR